MASQASQRRAASMLDFIDDDSPTSQRGRKSDFSRETDPLARSENKRKSQLDFHELSSDEQSAEEHAPTPPPRKKPRGEKSQVEKAVKVNKSKTTKSALRNVNPNPKFTPVIAPKPSAKSAGKQKQRQQSPPARIGLPESSRRRSQSPLDDADEEEFSQVIARTTSKKKKSSVSKGARLEKAITADASATPAVETYTMAEQEAFNQLEIQNRQYYICGLNRRDFQLPARNVFTDMSSANPIFILALKKTGRDFKNWKAVLLNKFCEHAENWAKDQLRRKLGGNELRTVAEIRRAIRDSFDISWIPQLWTVFRGIIDWRSVSDVGYQWLQYVTCHMMAVIRMQKINETFREPGYAKYTREYVLQTYDGLHLRFAGRLSVADFPLTEVPSTTARHASRPFIDPYEDSDGEIEDDFYTDFSNIDRSNLFV